MTSFQLRHWSAEMHANGLLDSAKPGHIEPTDQSAVKKTDDGYQGEGYPYQILSGLIIVAVIITVCLSDKLGKIRALL